MWYNEYVSNIEKRGREKLYEDRKNHSGTQGRKGFHPD